MILAIIIMSVENYSVGCGTMTSIASGIEMISDIKHVQALGVTCITTHFVLQNF